MKADLKHRLQRAGVKVAERPKEPTGELVAVDYEKAKDVLLSHSQTELSISESLRRHERQAVQIEANIASARAGIAQAFKDAGLPFSPYERSYRWDPKAKAIYLMPKPAEEKPA